MDKEIILEYLRRFDQTFSLLKNDNLLPTLYMDISAYDISNKQQEYADRLLQNGSPESDNFFSGALIFYGYRMGAVCLKGKTECITRQDGYKDNAVFSYSLDGILDAKTDENNPDSCASNIIDWIINPGSNTDISDSALGKMIIPMIKTLYKTSTPGKRTECNVVLPPVSVDIEVPDWTTFFSTLRVNNLLINIKNYGHLLNLKEHERQYILQHQTNHTREYVIVSAYEVIRGHNTCLGCLAFDVNNFDHKYILQDIKPITLVIDNRREQYERKKVQEHPNDWNYLPSKFPFYSGFNSFLATHSASFGKADYKPSGIADVSYPISNAIKAVFRENEALQVVDICARLTGEQNLYNISLGDLVYIASILQRDRTFMEVSIETKKDYQLGTYKKFGNEINLNKLDSIPANYSSISWRIKDKRKKTIPYFDLKKANPTYIQIIESVVNYYRCPWYLCKFLLRAYKATLSTEK